MEKQSATPSTIGQAIDELIRALGSIDAESQLTAIRAACEHLKIPLFDSAPPSLASPAVGATPSLGSQQPPPRITDIKSFRNAKQPTSANDMAAIVAFYLSELAPADERKSEVQTADMVKYFKQAGFPLPKQPRMLLSNAKNSGYFDSSGTGYKLNPVGYNLVAHNLPRKAGEAPTPGRRRKPKTVNRKAKTKRTKRT